MSYDLLRKFDPATAVVGDSLLFITSGNHVVEYNNWFVIDGALFVMTKTDKKLYQRCDTFDKWRIKPLRWFEDKPVYVGDTMYMNKWSKSPGTKVTITGVRGPSQNLGSQPAFDVEGDGFVGRAIGNALSWEKPKTKREGYVVVSKLALQTLGEVENILANIVDSNKFVVAKAEWEE